MKRFVKRAACAAVPFLLLLAPEAARADNECGTISSTAQTATCTATHGGGSGTFGSGILYVNAAPGANNVATVVVPGGSTPWAVTAAAGSGNERKNAITLDSDGAAAGGLALTVGGAGATANQVAIARHATNTDTGDAGNGIYVNQQRTGASTTTLTVNAGVTIGTSSAPMRSHGIRANVWLGTGAATFTNHGAIHSVSAGIYVNRGDSADTTAATTITNTGAITAGTRVIQLRYFAGDTTGSGGNTASTTTGDAAITNSGVLTKNAGTGNQGAIELDYDRGHGDATITNRGAITYGSGATGGYGIYLNYNNRAGTATGDATITNTAAVASAGHAIYLNYGGRGGTTSITNSGALTATAASSFGIYLFEHGTLVDPATKVVTVDNSGDITSTGLGINVNVRNKNIAGSAVGISITHSAGDIVVSTAGGIKANIADADDVADRNEGDIRIMVTGGSVQSRDTVLEASHSQAGDVIFEVSEGVTLTSTAQHVIFANIPSANMMGGVTITNAADLTGPAIGIWVRRQAATGTGAISIVNSGDIKRNNNPANQDGILVDDSGTGNVTVSSSGDIGEAGGLFGPAGQRHERGIRVDKSGDGGDISITTTDSSIFANRRGIWASHAGNSGSISITTTGGSITVTDFREDYGILASHAGNSGDISITTTGGSITAENNGILVRDNANHTGEVTISNGGDVTAEHPIRVDRSGSGAVTVANTGGTVLSMTQPGIFAANKAGDASTVTVNAEGGTVQSMGQSKPAIHAWNRGTGDVTVAIAAGATLISKHAAGLFAPLGDAPANQVDIDQGGTIMGRTGVYVRVAHGTTAETVTPRAASAQPLIDVTWSGTFSHGTTAMVAPTDEGRFVAENAASALTTHREVETEKTIRYGSAAGIEAQVMSWGEMTRKVAAGDDPGELADDAARAMAFDTGSTDAALKARSDAVVAQFKAVLENDDVAVGERSELAAAIDDIDDNDDNEYSAEEIAAYLSAGTDEARTLLRNVMRLGLSDKEKRVLKALAMDDRAGLTTALDDADAGFSDDYKTAVRALLDRYNVGDIRVNMTGGSIDSRGDGIRAYYATHHVNNGAIDVTVAAGATVEGDRAGIWVANAGAMGTGDDEILKQSVTVNGMVTGGADAAVHLVGGGTLTVGATGMVFAGAGQPAILVNDPGRSVIRIDGTVTGSEGAEAAVDLDGGGSVTVGPKGRIAANGATRSLRANGETVVTVRQDPDFADGEGRLTREGTDDAAERLGAVGGDVVSERGGAQGVAVRVAETDRDSGRETGYYLPAPLNETSGVAEPERHESYASLEPCGRGRELDESGECATPPKEENVMPVRGDGPPLSFDSDCGMERCRLYEALPSALLAMNGLPTYGERMAAARDGNGGWARIDGASGEWKAKTDAAFDYRRYGVQAGMDLAMDGDGRFGVSVRGLQGSAEMSGTGGEMELSGVGAGVHGTAFLGDGFHVDAQAMATWYDVKLTSGRVLTDSADGRGFAMGLEVGRRTEVGDGLAVTPAVGLAWSDVSLDFAETINGDARKRVSLDDARSLMGRVGARVEARMEDGLRLSGSVEATHEFSDERATRIADATLKTTEARKTGARLGIGGSRSWEDGRYALRAAAGYAARGSGNGEFDGGVSFALRF